MSWKETCEQKINELKLIADWGAITGLGRVRDACRTAISAIEADLSRFDATSEPWHPLEMRLTQIRQAPIVPPTISPDNTEEGYP